jgi:putative transposase
MPESLQQLDLLLLTVPSARKVHADSIRFQGLRYVDTVLAAYVGGSVTLRYDPRDLAEVRVFRAYRAGSLQKRPSRSGSRAAARPK